MNRRRPHTPTLPPPAGLLSAAVREALQADVGRAGRDPDLGGLANQVTTGDAAIGDDDLQLALYLLYELHYSSFGEVDPAWEWSPGLIAFRAVLERVFLDAVRGAVGPVPDVAPEEVGQVLFALAADDRGPSLSRHLERHPDLEQFREFVIHRSAYQLKEADPHSWAIPRLAGPAKSALVEIQADEYGGGRPERMHSGLFAKTMRALGLDDRPGGLIGRLPGQTLATVNLMSAFGLNRRLRGAIIGHLAMFEMTSSLPNRSYGNALRKLGFGSDATDFYDEHVEADAVHENIAAYDLAQGLAQAEPELTPDILFGALALLELDRRFAVRVLGCWSTGCSSLRGSGQTSAAVPAGDPGLPLR